MLLQDDFGTLCISGHSDETPIPSNIESMAPLAHNSHRNFSHRDGVVRGVVLDPNQIINGNNQWHVYQQMDRNVDREKRRTFVN